MIKRLAFIFLYILTFPIAIGSLFVVVCIMMPIAFFIWVFKGDENNELDDFIWCPLIWASNLPYTILGE